MTETEKLKTHLKNLISKGETNIVCNAEWLLSIIENSKIDSDLAELSPKVDLDGGQF
tara:strand:+ start:408 stop:578 length:171 start_codon:yes stop_codon:yes gene_type:complete